MEVLEIKNISNEILSAINKLLPQVSTSTQSLSEKALIEIINSDSSNLLMAIENGQYYGSLTLVTFKIPTGNRAWIEDVVVDEKARGQGIGKLLTEHAIELAKRFGAKTVDLTSRPSRQAANALYKKVGFEQRETNVYRCLIT